MNRGDQYRLRIADLPVTIRKLRKPQRCIVDATPIEAGTLAGTIAIRKREAGKWFHSQQYICGGCIASRCDANPKRSVIVESTNDREWSHRETAGRLPWE